MLGDFDREYTLEELLRGVDRGALAAALADLLGAGARLADGVGRPFAGPGGPRRAGVPVTVELEPLGRIEADAEAPPLRAAAWLLEQLLRANVRYQMASALHTETVDEGYEELQEKHAALQRSEARYRELAAQLEQRVAEQVRTIEATQRQLYQSEKLAAVGQLAAGVAHEINNPIGFIKSNLRTAADYLDALAGFGRRLAAGEEAAALREAWQAEEMSFVLEDFAALLKESREGAERVGGIVADLKGFSRVDAREWDWVDLNDLVRQAVSVNRARSGAAVEMTLDLSEQPELYCNASQIGEMIANLLHNALQAVGERGHVRLATAGDRTEVTVTVGDDGPGIPEAVRARIFEPFFTTREVGQGTGLGLTVANDIVRHHGGRIELQSTPGAGSTFTVYLPHKS